MQFRIKKNVEGRAASTGWENLNFAVFFTLRNRDFLFAKTGSISNFAVCGGGAIIDVDQDLKTPRRLPIPKIFGNLISGEPARRRRDPGHRRPASATFIKKQKKLGQEIAAIYFAFRPSRQSYS